MTTEKTNNAGTYNENKEGKFSKYVWIIILLGGLFMIYGGILDIMVYFERTLPFAPPSWHTIDTKISLICGIFILFAAVYLILKSLKIKSITEEGRKNKLKQLMKVLLMVCITGTIADFIAGYYARGFLIGLLGIMYLNYTLEKKTRYLYLLLVIITIIMIGFIWTGGK